MNRNWHHRWMLLGLLLLAGGCVHRYEREVSLSKPEAVCGPDSSYLVVAGSDGRFSGIVYEGSGRQAAGAMAEALARQGAQARAHSGYLPIEESLILAERTGMDCLIYLRMVHWEDQDTKWTGRPDRIRIEVVVYRAGSGSQVRNELLAVKGDSMEMLSQPAGDMLGPLFRKFVSRMFADARKQG